MCNFKAKLVVDLLSNGMLTRVGIAVEDWANPRALAKFLALTFS